MSDLGNILIDMGSTAIRDYFAAKYGPSDAATYYPVVQQLADYGGSQSPVGIPFGEVVGDPGMAAGTHYLKWDKKLQSWVTHKHRRRRRRLLTPTDLSDLAVLQSLVGKGSESMKFAVMKAVRR